MEPFADGALVLGKLRVVRKLGAGGIGAVYEVDHTLTKHRRALKVLHGPFRDNADLVERFLREASAAGRIGDPHIVETFDAGKLDDGTPWFVGMHFFNPVHKMPLVEVIRGEKSSDVAVATVFDLAKKMGKLPVVVKDGPGFLVNRILVPYLVEAAWLLQDGMSIETVDARYKKEFGMPMGPFTLMDEIGIDVSIKVSKIFHESLGDRIMIPPVMKKLAENKERLGKKSKKGFYLYDDKGKQLEIDQTISAELGLGQPSDKLSADETVRRGIFPMVNEPAMALIEEKDR